MDHPATTVSGGCQCGAVRYRFSRPPGDPSICHCRMCQKAFGNFFAPFVYGPADTFALTRGSLATFMSSDNTERGFCRDCGTPLSFRYLDMPYASVSIGSLDDPAPYAPLTQYGIESRLHWFGDLPKVPDGKSTEDVDPARAAAARANNHQHPDHDTAHWEPR